MKSLKANKKTQWTGVTLDKNTKNVFRWLQRLKIYNKVSSFNLVIQNKILNEIQNILTKGI